MFENIFETIVIGSDTVFLDLPKEEYVSKYNTLSLDSAQSLAEKYFENRGEKVIPEVRDFYVNEDIHRVKITVQLKDLN
ncbi:hypothetical protein [uncultured Clostridium sp.]|uniref:hypothetical protein n=1 Tax=uncultured Clostridium sp. TaxID=59620 RepID=UPI0028E78EFF|nr:hypothetical protein [uncultured Clostridium sp.]